jgi:protocatechuate 3,4-dioxygenase alpha subunit
MTDLRATPSQTVGPFFEFGMSWWSSAELVPPTSPGAVAIVGRVLDGDGEPVPDAVVETWQADTDGWFPGDGDGGGATSWSGFGRCLTDDTGSFRFTTVKPGAVDADQAPHVDVSVFARGLLQRLVTRLYFPDEDAANAVDPVLSAVDDPRRRASLVAVGEGDGLRFDIRLQGDDETVFFVW